MALITDTYQINGVTISPYAEITSKNISEYKENEVVKYKAIYIVNTYTSDTKRGDITSYQFEMDNIDKDITFREIEKDLQTKEKFKDWVII
jgi:hypothetical protein